MRLLIHDYGAYAFSVQLSRELARRNHTVTHAFAGGLTATPRGALARRTEDPASFSVREIALPSDYRRHKYSFLRRRRYETAYGHALASLTSRLEPSLILSGNTPTEPQWLLIKAARQQAVPVVTWVQDFYGLAVDRLARKKLPILGAMAGWWYRHLDALCYQQSAHIITITPDFLPVLGGLGVAPERITNIPNWAPLDELPERMRPNSWSTSHGLDHVFVFLYSGTLGMKHNPGLLVQLALRFREDPLVRVVVISEGPGADYLRERKKIQHLPNLLILPPQSYQEIPDVFAAADVLIAILEEDAGAFSVPSKVLSYHCAGRALLAAIPDNNLAARIIREANSGLCLPPGDLGGFLDAADSLRKNDSNRLGMASRARAYATREFDIKRIADRFEEVFQKVVGVSSTSVNGNGRHN